MATLYVANCTRQPHDFHYRIPAEDGSYTRRTSMQRIDPGTQQRVYSGDAAPQVIQGIIEQHQPYGLIPSSEVVSAKDFVGLCYSLDKPVAFDRLQYVFDHNHTVLVERGEQIREEAALATNLAINTAVEDAQRNDPTLPRAALKQVDVVTLEESDTPQFGQAISVTNAAPQRSNTRSRRRSG